MATWSKWQAGEAGEGDDAVNEKVDEVPGVKMQIFVKLWDGKTIPVDVEEGCTISVRELEDMGKQWDRPSSGSNVYLRSRSPRRG